LRDRFIQLDFAALVVELAAGFLFLQEMIGQDTNWTGNGKLVKSNGDFSWF